MNNDAGVIRAQGRVLSLGEFAKLQALIDRQSEWSRHRIARELCQQWNWRTTEGRLKTFAARELLLKLEQRHHLRLPVVRAQHRRSPWGIPADSPPIPAPGSFLEGSLPQVQPLSWELCFYGSPERTRALGLLRQYHYLGCNRPVGAHLLYLVKDRQGREVAVHLVGAAAWQCAPRDRYIGWNCGQRAAHLPVLANHSRFLILPWVRVPQLASHLIGELARRLEEDWPRQHGRSLLLLETFVEIGRFAGVAYRAAGWQEVGQTTGRTRQEKQHRASATRKSVWVYPLRGDFRQQLRIGGNR
jgi:hypothetical protein